MLDNLVSRKKEKTQGGENVPLTQGAKSNKKDGETDMRWIVVVWIVVMILIYHFHTPAHVKKAHKAKVDASLESIADGISAKRSSIASQIDNLKKSLALDKEEKVSIEHHEEEVGKLNTDIEEHKANVEKLETANKELETTLKETQARIEEKEKRLKELEAAEDGVTADISLFCEKCPFDYGGLRTSCGARAAYLVGHHGTEEKVAKEAVIKWDPNCAKKPES
jgi:TolA-binding protein